MDRFLTRGDICDGDAIAWQDSGDHFGMCETCYSQLCESEVRTLLLPWLWTGHPSSGVSIAPYSRAKLASPMADELPWFESNTPGCEDVHTESRCSAIFQIRN
ncbi:hypothetical protein ACKUB1_16290 [Methanospirillum stamsii]|uniref:Uncharacterized protein n=1 Tax=Methanospirillum stamsii TaxID=1277351 RepID=A0A2V2N8Z4_9EURY|nr:hypothetical protein [Methanospirillum stamsii]PWR75045.1 hypothetical protein DLD82_07460 [Methanospirillum stamsii]